MPVKMKTAVGKLTGRSQRKLFSVALDADRTGVNLLSDVAVWEQYGVTETRSLCHLRAAMLGRAKSLCWTGIRLVALPFGWPAFCLLAPFGKAG
jgi:hypothetical protein